MNNYDITFTAQLARGTSELLSDEMMDYYTRVGAMVEEMGVSTTVSLVDGDLNYDMTVDAHDHEEAQAKCLSTFATACLFMGARMWRRKERPFDAYRQN